MKKALKNETIRGYFNSAQAIADYAEVLVYLKKKFSAYNSPIIVIGASYGGSKWLYICLNARKNMIVTVTTSLQIVYIPQKKYDCNYPN